MSQKQQKGKQGTRGLKQIVEENVHTLSFYRNMVFISNAVFLAVTCVFFDLFSTFNIVMLVLSAIVYVGSYQFMAFMARAKYTDSGQLVDSGIDLNMEGGIAEHIKDLIILTAITQLLSLISNYFWWLWALAPARGFWMLWKNILGPWFFQPAPEDPQTDPKKSRKMERKMRGRY